MLKSCKLIILVGRANEVCKPRTILCVSLKIAGGLMLGTFRDD
jgi:hypothetical protein